MNYKGFVLYCDLDRVLLNGCDRVQDEDREALDRFMAGGGQFGVISDNSPSTARYLMRGVPTNTWSVVLSGAEAYHLDASAVAFPRVISQLSMAAFIRQIMNSLKDISILLYSESRLFCLTDPDLLDQRFRRSHPPYHVVGLDVALRFPWLGVRFFGPDASLSVLEKTAASWGIPDLARVVHDEPGSSTFVSHGASKLRCLRDLKCLDEFHEKRVILVGSAASDAELMGDCDLTVAASNAHEAVQKKAAHRVPDGACSLAWLIDELLPSLA